MVFVVWSVALSVVLKGSVSGGLGGAVALSVVLKERVWSVRGGAFHGAEGAPSGGVWGGTSHPSHPVLSMVPKERVCGLWCGWCALSVVLKRRGASGDWSSKPS